MWDIDLLEYLAQQAGTDYLSDLRYLDYGRKQHLSEVVAQVPVEAFTVDMWNDAMNYMAGQSPLAEALHAKYILVKRWEKHKNTS
ncbi:hypothetical protein [uncultured Oscillibacter sp.]|uniref:hypothetical protein n=1 Tax=uncultured Oscillibacter sp. TaxID=876091 RepID=UPI00280BC9E4|nr:hypothetical protein [uncultured Oscillibacter sp.]